ncbi:SAM-dependent methyltransferase [Nonomuraea fuscirosea]|uniref:SAM-dependent methyltransferase n=1 Tax=Nonomuraea fuscirosea TaxID=1291556 RepID=UPI00371E1A35
MSRPSPARMYDYFLGGTFNGPADRAAADQVLQIASELRDLAIANREFLKAAVRHVAGRGVGQFIDLGSGLPTQENVHEIAQAVTPDAVTVYVDNDPSVLAEAQQMIFGDPNTTYLQADARDPHHILTHPDTVKMIDFTAPVCVLMVAVLHFVGDRDDPYGIVDRFMQDLAPGSHLILAHATEEGMDPVLAKRLVPIAHNLPVPLTFRTEEQIRPFFNGLDILTPPGIVDVGEWNATGEPGGKTYPMRSHCAVARKP